MWYHFGPSHFLWCHFDTAYPVRKLRYLVNVMKRIYVKRMVLVKTHGDNAHGMVSDSYAVCPWCNIEWVYLCRIKPEGQWIPVSNKDVDDKGRHAPHRCPEALKRNQTLVNFLGGVK